MGVLVLAPAFLLTACGALPHLPQRPASHHLTDTGDTALGRAVQAAGVHDGRSGLRALSHPLEAFAARMLLARTAERSLDVERTAAGVVVHEEEPRASLWRRLLAALLALLPIEWLL